MERIYNKLVRDKIPEIIMAKGERPVTKKLSLQEYKTELEKKLLEECKEVLEANSKERVEELADVLEIVKALARLEGVLLDDVIEVANKKAAKRGGFDDRIFLEKVVT